MTVAALQSAEVDYGRRLALGPFSLDLQSGEIVGLVGPSGCGKSTALRLLAGLETPTRGGVTRAAVRGETSVVFQAPTLMPWASALDNVALPLELAGLPKAQARDLAFAGLAGVRLQEAGAVKPCQLSGGMAMRVSLARALATNPRLLLLDEPFAALDDITRRDLARDIHHLWAQQRPAILFVTHNVEEAVFMASRVLVMTPGPGRVAAEMQVDAPLPRPEGFRFSRLFLETVEQVSNALALAMAAQDVPA
jgi:NitT/TauT family transport system ATP-binding protein